MYAKRSNQKIMKPFKRTTRLSFTGMVIFCIALFIFSSSCVKQSIPIPIPAPPANPNPPHGAGGSQIIYTDVKPDSVISAFPNVTNTYFLDLNKDGIADFEIYAGSMNGRCAPDVTTHQPNVTFVRVKGFNANNFGDTILNAGGAIYPVPVDSGRKINQDLESWSTTNSIGTLNLYNSCSVGYGLWTPIAARYLPLRLIVGSNVYFGWVRVGIQLTSSAGIPSFHATIKDFAYNSATGQPILAGQTK
jgi:hypothetical protein